VKKEKKRKREFPGKGGHEGVKMVTIRSPDKKGKPLALAKVDRKQGLRGRS